MAVKFNSFSTTTYTTLVKNLHVDSSVNNIFSPTIGIKGSLKTFSLSTVSIDRVSNKLRKLDRSTAIGLDNLQARFVNNAAEQIAPSISHIINISIQLGKVP